jgi:indole-3-glycerol phosphate synthase
MLILDEIVAHKREEVAWKKSLRRGVDVKDVAPTRDFQSSLRGEGLSIIAEIKKCSPSRGLLRDKVDPAHTAALYEGNGAAAISVLTDEKYFCGSDEFVAMVKEVTDLPVLRKEFIIDAFQISESRILGADAILLIAAILDQADLADFLGIAHEVGLSCLVEVHTEGELERVLKTDVRILGLNNRDLTTMSVDLTTSLRLKRMVPADIVTVAESGVQGREDILKFEEAGFDAVLIGGSLMSAADIGAKLRELRGP